MSAAQDRLMNVLFGHAGREHIDVKFLSLTADPSMAKEEFCGSAAEFLEKMHTRDRGHEQFLETFTSVAVDGLLVDC